MDLNRCCLATVLCLALFGLAVNGQAPLPPPTPDRGSAKALLVQAGNSPGFIAVVRCGAGEALAALGLESSAVIHGVDTDALAVAEARRRLAALGLYGRVAADSWDGVRLPYADGMVNLLIVEREPADLRPELLRVLAPLGILLTGVGAERHRVEKPWPADIDEWSHYLHRADNNAVAEDTRIGPPRSLQWVGGPRWGRHHDHMASMSALVSAGTRLFYIFDEGPTSSIILPSRWTLIARDAFNGVVLWKRPIPEWQTRFWPLKSGPAQLPRRLVATRDTVFATLGIDVPLTALAAADGRVLRTYEGSASTVEVICSDGTLFLLVDPQLDRSRYTNARAVSRPWWGGEPMAIKAFEAASGRLLWSFTAPVVPLTLAADESRVYFHDGERLVALDRGSGEPVWHSEPVPVVKRIMSFFAPTLVVRAGVVVFAGGEESGLVKSTGGATKNDTITGLDAATGRRLWSAPHPPSGYSSPEDVFVIGDTVWFAGVSNGSLPGEVVGLDLRTGAVRQRYERATVDTYWFHHRCYRGKATSQYLMVSRTGIEFINPADGAWTINHWIRGGCLYGFMPANGLIYAPPNDCACFPETKLSGFCAAGPRSPELGAPGVVDNRRQEGLAYAWRQQAETGSVQTDDWPTYRGDACRSGASAAAVPAAAAEAWSVDLGGSLSALTVAANVLLVAQADAHTLHAIDATSGQRLWHVVAGGRIDSPPTIHEGTALFGAADGWITCVRLADGEQVWRFRAAPAESRLVAFEQLESRWPVHGSVLVQDGVVHAVAGRSLFVDGGMRYCRLDARTGQLVGEVAMDDRDPETGVDLHADASRLTMPVALPDILSSDGKHVYMRSQVFDLAAKRLDVAAHDPALGAYAAQQDGPTRHLFASAGFLDGSWFHRAYWIYGRSFEGGWNSYYLAGKRVPAGKILAVNAHGVFGFGRDPKFFRWTTPMEHQLFAVRPADAARNELREAPVGSLIRVKKSSSLNPAGQALAVAAWVRAEKPDGVILAHGGGVLGYALYLKDGKGCFAVANQSKLGTVVSRVPLPPGWAHLVGVLDSEGALSVFVNGVLAGTASGPGLIRSEPANELQIGGDEESQVGDYTGGLPFCGVLDDVRVLHGNVTAEMVRPWATTAGFSLPAGVTCVLHYPFDQGSAQDASGNGNNGTVVGAAWVAGQAGKGMRFAGQMPGAARETDVDYAWSQPSPIMVRGMVVTAQTLFVAGAEDALDEPAAMGALEAADTLQAEEKQDAGLQGLSGGRLLAIRCADGVTVATLDLSTIPVWDGLAAARGRLYMAGVDGTVRCFAGK